MRQSVGEEDLHRLAAMLILASEGHCLSTSSRTRLRSTGTVKGLARNSAPVPTTPVAARTSCAWPDT
jgi:hypothetical protein